jgi:hypothetical protein
MRFLSTFLAGKKDRIRGILRKVKSLYCGLIGFLPTVRDEKHIYIVFAIMTSEPRGFPIEDMKFVPSIFPVKRVMDDAIWVGTLTANLSGLLVKCVMSGSESALEGL